MKYWKFVRAGLMVAALIASGLVASSAAPASAATRSFGKHYLFTADRWSQPLHACVHIVLEGDVTYTASGPSVVNVYTFSNLTLKNPSLTVFLKQSCARTARTVAVGTQADLTQRWYSPYKNCSLNPSIGVGVPWSATISATPHCSNRGKVARRSSHPNPDGRTSRFDQFNSGRPAHWNISRHYENCVLYTATVQVYNGAASDTFGIGGKDTGVCVSARDGVPAPPYSQLPDPSLRDGSSWGPRSR